MVAKIDPRNTAPEREPTPRRVNEEVLFNGKPIPRKVVDSILTSVKPIDLNEFVQDKVAEIVINKNDELIENFLIVCGFKKQNNEFILETHPLDLLVKVLIDDEHMILEWERKNSKGRSEFKKELTECQKLIESVIKLIQSTDQLKVKIEEVDLDGFFRQGQKIETRGVL